MAVVTSAAVVRIENPRESPPITADAAGGYLNTTTVLNKHKTFIQCCFNVKTALVQCLVFAVIGPRRRCHSIKL